ncbi:hypothetical protein GCM10027290_64860 [Micromonospora sonneratiae]|uniref:Fibronectin type III domain-containing protein n=1 Tax=Micromonospora sonneratiae TaxID=1184706 RepID=A0ABW3Y9K4_9ACTN
MRWIRVIGARIRRGFSGVMVIAVAGALVGTVFGLGAMGQAPEIFDGSAWLWSRSAGEVSRVNASSGQIDLRQPVVDSRGHRVRITQNDQYLILQDLDTGRITSVDLTRMGFSGALGTEQNNDVAVLLSKSDAVLVDRTRGLVRTVDPASLQVRGEPLQLPAPLVGGAFDTSGVLWLGLPSQGTVVGVSVTSAEVDVLRTVPVAPPGNDLALTVLDKGALAVDRTTDQMVAVVDDKVRRITAPTRLHSALVPDRTVGPLAAVTVPQARVVVTVEDIGRGGPVHSVPLPAGEPVEQPALPFAGRIYVPDHEKSRVRVYTASGGELPEVRVTRANGDLELQVREQHLFINAPDAPVAAVVDSAGQVRVVDKYGPEASVPEPTSGPVDGASPTPDPTTRPGDEGAPTAGPGTGPDPGQQPDDTPQRPAGNSRPPGPPVPVTVLAGDNQVTLNWGRAASGGAAVDRYTISWDGGETRVGGRTLSTVVRGLRNGRTYQFRVTAHNRYGDGPPALSEPVVPVDRTPPAPGAPTARLEGGRVVVSWAAVSGAVEYVVTPLRGGRSGDDPPRTVRGTSTEFAGLTYGASYTFVVVARNDAGGAGPASPPSNAVTPYSVPGQPGKVSGRQSGTNSYLITWTAANPNGRPVQSYLVRDGNGQQLGRVGGAVRQLTVTATGLTRVSVSAVNEAGEGRARTANVTQASAPQVRITGVSATSTSARVSFTVAASGLPPSCVTRVGDRPAVSGCGGSTTVSGLSPNRRYVITVEVTTAAGTNRATGEVTTPWPTIGGTVSCQDRPSNPDPLYCTETGGIRVFATPNYRPGTEVGRVRAGSGITVNCRVTGSNVKAGPYNNDKQSNQWLRMPNGNYIAWAWVTLSGGDNINSVPSC